MDNIIQKSIINLFKRRNAPFHSEDQFKFLLAWQIALDNKDSKELIEVPETINQKNVRIDIMVKINNQFIPIELKYKTKAFEYIDPDTGQSFSLKDQAATDIACYDFLRDIQKIESLMVSKEWKSKIQKGYAIMLTNVAAFWSGPRKGAFYEAFSLVKSKKAHDEYEWVRGVADGTKRGREMPIVFNNDYDLSQDSWNTEHTLWRSKKGGSIQFKYIFVEVNK